MKLFNKPAVYAFRGALFLAFILCGNSSVLAQTNRLVTANSAGAVRIGMTVTQARRAMRGYTFRRVSDGEGIALIEVRRRNTRHMTLYAGEFDPAQPIDNTAKIEFIEVWSSLYKTAAGVYPLMRVRDVESRYGKVTSIMLSEIEAREYARFTSQPSGIDFRLRNRSGTAGVYPSGQTTTTRYSNNATIFSLIVLGGLGEVSGGDGDNGNDVTTDASNNQGNPTPSPSFTSQYTDFRTQCQTPRDQGDDGGHVSTYCSGVGGYRIHIFDSATTLEINVEATNDPSRTIHLASQSLSFDGKNTRAEWRIRDGKPFAVIMRGYKYQLGDDGLIQYPVRRTGEFLFVKGLPGYENIDSEVNARESNANEKARQTADAGYDGKKTASSTNAAFQNININNFNRIIDSGSRNRQAWVKSPMQTAIKLIGEIQEVKTRNIRFVSPSAEGGSSMTVVVTDDGLLDDSVRTERLRLQLKRNAGGVWRVVFGRRSWRCQQGRGHQNFSAAPCS